MAVNYNIINLPIDTALDNREISGGKTYLILLEAPVGANVRIRLEENTADEIPLSSDFALKCGKANRIYVSSDAVAGGSIKLGVSDTTLNGFEIIPSPVVDSIDTIGEVTELVGISTALNTALDKIINPYQNPTITQAKSNNSGLTTILSKTLTCDRIRLYLDISLLSDYSTFGNAYVSAFLDGYGVAKSQIYAGYSFVDNPYIDIKNVNGKLLEIKGSTQNTNSPFSFILLEYDLKA